MKCETQPFDIEAKVRQDCYNRGYEQGRKNPAEEIVEYIEKLQKQVKEYQDKIEQGTLIELPCKVGDTVYMLTQVVVDFVSYKREWRIHKFQIDSIGIDDDGDFFTQGAHKDFYFGRDIFATREEAEKRLKELQECSK